MENISYVIYRKKILSSLLLFHIIIICYQIILFASVDRCFRSWKPTQSKPFNVLYLLFISLLNVY